MINKTYKSEIAPEIQEALNNKIKSKIFGLLCEREKDGNWEAFLDNILMELIGYPVEKKGIDYYRVIAKLSTSRYLEFKYFRSVIFDCMEMIDKWNVGL